jgi:hypothetical protein
MAKLPAERPASAQVALALWAIVDRAGVRLPAPSIN